MKDKKIIIENKYTAKVINKNICKENNNNKNNSKFDSFLWYSRPNIIIKDFNNYKKKNLKECKGIIKPDLKIKSKIDVILFILLFIISFISQTEPKMIKLRQLSCESKIKITIPNSGEQQILSGDFISTPDKIKINGLEVNSQIKSYNFNSSDNIIELIWNEPITNCSYMFSNCKMISTIDLSNFDSS